MSVVADTGGETADESTEIHAVGDWTLVVQADGAVEARTHWDNGDPKVFTTAPIAEAPSPNATYRYGKTIEGVLARYTHETRFDRDLNERENGAAFRNGIIEALCELAPPEFLGDGEGRPVGVVHVNAPTGPSTHIVAEGGADTGTYATFHPFEDGEGDSGTDDDATTRPDADHWGQPTKHFDAEVVGAGEARECQSCGSCFDVAMIAATAENGPNWEEFYECQSCDARGAFRFFGETGRREWTGRIGYPEDG